MYTAFWALWIRWYICTQPDLIDQFTKRVMICRVQGTQPSRVLRETPRRNCAQHLRWHGMTQPDPGSHQQIQAPVDWWHDATRPWIISADTSSYGLMAWRNQTLDHISRYKLLWIDGMTQPDPGSYQQIQAPMDWWHDATRPWIISADTSSCGLMAWRN